MKRFSILLALLATASLSRAQAAWSPEEKQIFDQLNHAREEARLPALEWNAAVANAARAHSRRQAENGDMSHQFRGEATLPERVAAAAVRFTVSAENVARTGYIEDVHPALMSSSGHRANMLNPAYNAVGIGIVESGGKLYVTQDFIFLVPEYSEAQFNAAFAESFNLARKAKGIRAIDARPDAQLHGLACRIDGDDAMLATNISGARAVVVFTSSDPHHLPEQLQARVANPDFHRMTFGACFHPDRQHGYANFWVVASFAD